MAHTPCSPTELVNLHSYSFGANDAMQNLQCRLCTKGFERTILWVKRTPFSATKIIQHPASVKPRSAAIQSMNNFTLTTLSRGSKTTQGRQESGEIHGSGYTASLSDGSFCGVKLQQAYTE